MTGIRHAPFLEILKDASAGNKKILQKDFLASGKYPIIDQGQSLIAGYTEEEDFLCKADIPVIVFGDHTRAVKYIDFPFAMGADGTKILVPRKGDYPKYLYYAIKAINIEGAGYSRHFKYLKEKKIPLPPLPEQKRIAAILDAADALRAKRRQSIAELDALLQATFLEMFGDPVENPKGWDSAELGKITSIDALMVDPRDEEYQDLLHYGPDRIEKDSGNLLPALTAAEDQLVSGKFLCHPGEVLYSKIRPYLNKVALVKERCLCSADVYPVKPNDQYLNKEYLWFLLRSNAFLDYVAGFSRRANIPKVNREQFSGYIAPIPPVILQNEFKKIVGNIEIQKARLQVHLAELDMLFASLQQRAFNGEL